MTALLVVHGLATPGALVGDNGVIAVSGAAVLPLGATVLALSTHQGPSPPRAVKPLLMLDGVLGAAILGLGERLICELEGFPDQVRRLVLDHHERLDRRDYPRGLGEDELDLETRILMVCDVYDALISTRVYREAWTVERALGLLRDEAGQSFDPSCVAALEVLLAHSRQGPGITPIAA